MTDESDPDDTLLEALKNVYANKGRITGKELFDITGSQLGEAIQKGFGEVKFGEPNHAFLERLKNNGAAFAARKTQHQIKDLTKILYDENGNLKGWSKFREDAAKTLKNYNQTWLRTEYETAVRRARIASAWHDSEDNEIYTNMRWLPSRSVDRRLEHIPFYDKVFSRDDAVWNYGPGTLWGCKCGVEPTDDPVSDAPKISKAKPDAGIDNNPGESGEIFTGTHPYFSGLTKQEIAAAKELEDAAETERMRTVKKELTVEMKPLYDKTVEINAGDKIIAVGFEKEGNRHVVDDIVFPKGRAHGLLTYSELVKIDELLKNATFVTSTRATGKKVKKGYKTFYYFKDANKELYYNIAKIIEGSDEKHFLYSVTKEIKK
jgi:hypothetical protein